jgi:hypothetical protein
VSRLPHETRAEYLWTLAHVAWGRTVYAIETLGYWIRPYDMIADARRWCWQPRAKCGARVWADMPDDVKAQLAAAARRGGGLAVDPDADFGPNPRGPRHERR